MHDHRTGELGRNLAKRVVIVRAHRHHHNRRVIEQLQKLNKDSLKIVIALSNK
jgi:hypothetical protein